MEVEYYYLSGDGSPKGPFALKKMREWHQFYPLQMNLDVMVRCGGEGSFTPLREFAEIISTAEAVAVAAAPASAPAAAVAESSSSSVALVPRTALQWFYSVDGSEYGPYSVEQLRLWESSGYFTDFAEVPVRSDSESSARTSLAELLASPDAAGAAAAAAAAAAPPSTPSAAAASGSFTTAEERALLASSSTPNTVSRQFESAMASLGVSDSAGMAGLVQAPAVAQLRELAARVRESQAELDNRSSDLQAGLFSTIEALQESHQRAEGMLDEKIRECEALRAENEKLRMHLKLHSNQSMGESGTPSFSSRW